MRLIFYLLIVFLVFSGASPLTNDYNLTVSSGQSDPVSNSLSLSNQDDLVLIEAESDFSKLGFPGSGTANDPYRIEHLTISSSEGILILIRDIPGHFIIRNNSLNGVENQFNGIQVINSRFGTIKNNEILNTKDGVVLISSNDNLITSNIIANNQNNGVSLIDAMNNTLSNNKISNNTNGVFVEASSNTIKNNQFQDNSGFGVIINKNSTNNFVIWNNFIQNNASSISQAFDDGQNNIFLNNFWDEFPSTDTNDDKIVDKEYQIVGAANNTDARPYVQMNLIHFEELPSGNISTNFFDNIQIPFILIGMLVLLIFLFQLVISSVRRFRWTKLSENVIKSLLGVVPPLLVTIIDSSKKDLKKFNDLAPIELYSFKFLLNPIRLSILKILHENGSYPSYRLRDELGVTWGNYSSNLASLEERGLIMIKEEFLEESGLTKRKVVFLEERGRIRFIELQSMLRKLFG